VQLQSFPISSRDLPHLLQLFSVALPVELSGIAHQIVRQETGKIIRMNARAYKHTEKLLGKQGKGKGKQNLQRD